MRRHYKFHVTVWLTLTSCRLSSVLSPYQVLWVINTALNKLHQRWPIHDCFSLLELEVFN